MPTDNQVSCQIDKRFEIFHLAETGEVAGLGGTM
jgi:hypothetical protein